MAETQQIQTRGSSSTPSEKLTLDSSSRRVVIKKNSTSSFIATGYSLGYLGPGVDNECSSVLPPPLVLNVQGAEIRARSIKYSVKHVDAYYITRVVSPFEFYMEPVFDSKKLDIEIRYKRMQDYYNKRELKSFEYRIEVSVFKCYAYHDPVTKTWWRVRVLKFDGNSDGSYEYVLVYYCDSAKQEYIRSEELRELTKEFLDWEAPLYKCYLIDVLPIKGGFSWPAGVQLYFKELVEKERLSAVVMKWSEKKGDLQFCDSTFDCGVVLFRTTEEHMSATINWKLVENGYAQSIGIMAASGKMLNVPGMEPHFEYTTSQDTSPIEYMPKPIPIETLREITSNAIASFDYHWKSVERPRWQKEPDNYLPACLRERLSWMKITYVEGPAKIFVQNWNKHAELNEMQNELETLAKELPISNLKKGDSVCCEMKEGFYYLQDLEEALEEDYQSGPNSWCRAVILTVEEETKFATVVLVDYGNVLEISCTDMYELPEKFRSIPSFAHRVHLGSVRPVASSNWDAFAIESFYKYVASFEPDCPLYFAHLLEKHGIIHLVDVEQCLVFDDGNGMWMADPTPACIRNERINSMKKDPLLASFYQSFPVELWYEMFVEDNACWEFESLADFLVDRKFGELVTEDNKSKIHEVIVNGFGTL